MKPINDRLAIVTASTNLGRAKDCLQSWRDRAAYACPTVIVLNGVGDQPMPDADLGTLLLRRAEHDGVVPAFAAGVTAALEHTKAEFIICLHDDVLIEQDGWDVMVLDHFIQRPACGLAGFGGGKTLGATNIYQVPYDPMQLARGTFMSNMRDAEAHGQRWLMSERVACLDGFSQIGRRAFWEGRYSETFNQAANIGKAAHDRYPDGNLFDLMEKWGIVHHAYDAALGCFAKRLGWDVWTLPVACHHFGGRTAVADTKYHDWAKAQIDDGDQGFWKASHRIVYDQFRDVLPIDLRH